MIDILLAYVRISSYTIVIISSFYALRFGVKSIRRLFWSNIVFSSCTILSIFSFVVNIFEFQKGVNIFVTLGSLVWAGMTFSNIVRN